MDYGNTKIPAYIKKWQNSQPVDCDYYTYGRRRRKSKTGLFAGVFFGGRGRGWGGGGVAISKEQGNGPYRQKRSSISVEN